MITSLLVGFAHSDDQLHKAAYNGEIEIVDWEQVTKNTIEFCESQFNEIDEINTIADRLIEIAAALRKANNVGGK